MIIYEMIYIALVTTTVCKGDLFLKVFVLKRL